MLEERLARLRQKLPDIPTSPGIYLHKDGHGKILYVGKAKDLRARLRSYFAKGTPQSPKTEALVRRIEDFEVIVVENEHEALVLENNLIKVHRPQYNVLLRDDKTYPYLRIDLTEPWPRLVRTRQRRDDGALYFGPYTNVGDLARVLHVIERVFPLVKCPPTVFRNSTRPCNYHAIGRCLAPCALPVDRNHYLGIVDDVVAILQGRIGDITEKITHEMTLAAENLAFEKAAALRDQKQALDNLRAQQGVQLPTFVNVDVIGSCRRLGSLCFYVAKVREGKVVAGEAFVVAEIHDAGVSGTAEQFLCQYYQTRAIPSAILFPLGEECFTAEQLAALKIFLASLSSESGKTALCLNLAAFLRSQNASGKRSNLRRPDVAALCRIADANATERFEHDLRTDEATRAMLVALQRCLGLDQLPARIECYDISTFQGSETVAAQVVFQDGKPAKSEYRKYLIKEHVRQDDFAGLREVMGRRFKSEKRGLLPDLLLIDGGTPQVREVGWVLKSLGLSTIFLAGIAKARVESAFTETKITVSSERLVIPRRDENNELLPDAEPETVPLHSGSPEYRLVTRVRDETHRFAITFHRSRRDNVRRGSVWHTIDGLGPKRRRKLLTVFASLQEIASASIDEIASRAGLPHKVASLVKAAAQRALTE